MSSLQGGPELRARLMALKDAFKPMGKDWAEDAARIMAASVPVRTGALKRSFKARSTTRKAVVVGRWTAFFIDSGTRAHDETPGRVGARLARRHALNPTARSTAEVAARQGHKAMVFQGRQGIVFAKRVHHPGIRRHSFRARAAREALTKHSPLLYVIQAWNSAGRSARLKAA